MPKFFERLIVIIIAIGFSIYFASAATNYFNDKKGDSLIDGCPFDMVFVPNMKGGFCIDRYEASTGEGCLYSNPDSEDKTISNLNNGKCKAVSVVDSYPWRYISRNQSMVACAKAGKRLATNKEWYQASLGTPDVGPWGADSCQVSNNWEEQPGKTGTATECKSGVGAYDMVGNVWEWVAEEVQNGVLDEKILPGEGYILEIDNEGIPTEIGEEPSKSYNSDYLWLKDTGVRALARGGYWDNKERAGFYSLYVVSKPNYVGRGVGFRCVK